MRLELKQHLDALYRTYNHPDYVRPDPLECVLGYRAVADREIAALVAASLAFGRVAQILNSVRMVLECMERPARFVDTVDAAELRRRFRGFRHRYVSGADLADLLLGVKYARARYGGLEACFAAGLREGDATVLAALTRFVEELRRVAPGRRNFLLPSPAAGSACKRLNLYLRWMVRRDAVDPGGWPGVPAAKLVVPLDTHLHRLARELDLTRRKQADLRTALEVTGGFRRLAPQDPVRYDFALTRLGIRADTDPSTFVLACREGFCEPAG